MRWLALLFLVVPLVELWLLLRVGDVVGFWPTIALVLAAALLGAWLAKREGLRVLRSWRQAIAEMRVPEEGVVSGLLVLAGAVLLISPGVLTDVVGIGLLVPVIRRPVARALEKRLMSRFMVGGQGPAARGVYSRGAGASLPVFDVDGQAVVDQEEGRQ